MRKRPWSRWNAVQIVEHESASLRGNPLGDPSRRTVAVYLPPGYDAPENARRRYPVLVALAGFTGSGLYLVGWRNFSENLPERLDRLISEGRMGPVIVACPDCFTALGGNQYIDSTAMGAYARYLVEDLVPFIDGRYRTLASREHRGIFGKSSGGYGALAHGMGFPEVWGAVACHSGDMYFDFCYLPALPQTLNVLAAHDRSVESFLAWFNAREKPTADEITALMFIAMAATYDPDPAAPLGFHLPCDLYTGELNRERWDAWLAHDPIHRVASTRANLARLELLYLDCGTKDQFSLHYGARILSAQLTRAGVPHVHEEFTDDHSSVDYRLDRSLPLLYEAIAPPG